MGNQQATENQQEPGRKWSRATVAIVALWSFATAWHMLAGNWIAAVTSSLMLFAILLIVAAVLSRARKSRYPSQ